MRDEPARVVPLEDPALFELSDELEYGVLGAQAAQLPDLRKARHPPPAAQETADHLGPGAQSFFPGGRCHDPSIGERSFTVKGKMRRNKKGEKGPP